MQPDSVHQSGRLEHIAFYFLLGAIILAPLAFWPSAYVPLDLVKTVIIALGTLVSVILFGFVAVKERRIMLPPKSLLWVSIAIVVSMLISSFLSIQIGKSIFGQGFEIGTASFGILLFVAGLSTFVLSSRRPDRVIILYVGMAAAFLILYIFQVLRLFFGVKFMSFGMLNTITSSVIGPWFNIGIFSIVIALVSLSALAFLPLSRRMKIVYWVLTVLAIIATFIVNNFGISVASTIVFLGLTVFVTLQRERPTGGRVGAFFKGLAWVPAIVFIISLVITWRGTGLARPVTDKLNVTHAENVLPWQYTLDVTSQAIKSYPLFGVGPNHFVQAYLTYKPSGINNSDFWNTEFINGFGLIPTFVTTQGVVGLILWVLFFIFFGIAGARALRRLPTDPAERFIIVSSYAAAVFLWLMAILSVPSHALVFYAFVFSGIFLGTAVAHNALTGTVYSPAMGTRAYKILPSALSVLVLIALIWGLQYVKKTVALSFFSKGIHELTASSNYDAADADFARALSLDKSDVYWQGRAETALARVTALGATINANTPAATTQTVLKQINDALNQGLTYARSAVAYDPTNYYNYLSQARISEAAANLHLGNGYENAVAAYTTAANLNPYNPSIYLSLGRLQASQNKLDDALRSVGASLQVKNNYLDGVFLLSQIYAAKGDLASSITAASVATQLNPTNPLLLFQLGLFKYNNKDYDGAATALKSAVSLQADYANAKYFLGLALARLGRTDDAITQFESIAVSNPDNQEIGLILNNLKQGRPIFADAVPPITTAPEKRSSLPIKEKR
jgi:cytochrome c-type biogenesis protein CcmH/NrfG